MLFITKNAIRVFLTFWKIVDAPSNSQKLNHGSLFTQEKLLVKKVTKKWEERKNAKCKTIMVCMCNNF